MAVTLGTNSGFVTTVPTEDPAGTNLAIQVSSWAGQDTAPATATKITKIGWYCDNATEEANFQVGLYDHDATNTKPNNRLYVSTTNAKGTTAGWKSVVVDWDISPNTIYWIAIQIDNTATQTNCNYGAAQGVYLERKYASTSLTDPWGTSSAHNLITPAIYAVWEAGGGGAIYETATATLTDTISINRSPKIFNISFTETTTLSDIFSRQAIFNQLLSEIINITDVSSIKGILNRLISEELILSDAFSREGILNKFLTESLELLDALSAQTIKYLNILESLILSDNLFKQGYYRRNFLETATLSDIISIIKITNLSKQETITLSDITSINRSIKTTNLSFTDTTTLTDIAYPFKVGGAQTYNLYKTDSISLNDIISANRSIKTSSISIFDTTILSDTISITKITNLSKTDISTLTDIISIKKISSIQKTESLNLTDAISLKKITNLSVIEAINLTDTAYPYLVSGPQTYNLYKTDDLTLSDIIQITRNVKTFNNSFSETITLTDTSSAGIAVLSLYKLIFNPFTCNFDWVTI